MGVGWECNVGMNLNALVPRNAAKVAGCGAKIVAEASREMTRLRKPTPRCHIANRRVEITSIAQEIASALQPDTHQFTTEGGRLLGEQVVQITRRNAQVARNIRRCEAD